MKITKYIKTAPFVALLGMLGGCNDFLDQVPDERVYIDSREKVAALLVNAYPKVSMAALVNTRCDNVTDFGSTVDGSQPMGSFDFMVQNFMWRDEIVGGNDTFENFWAGCYEAISVANHALKAIRENGGPEAMPDEYGEALMARAFAHHYLVSLFSYPYESFSADLYPGIPYVTEPEEEPIVQYSRGTVGETYMKIVADIEEGFRYMTGGENFKAPAFHFTRSSAAAFAVRVYSMMGYYSKVIEYANTILPNASEFMVLTDGQGLPMLNTDGSVQRNVSPNDLAFRDIGMRLHPFSTEYMGMSSSESVNGAFGSSKSKANLLITEAVSMIAWSHSFSFVRHGLASADVNRTYLGSNATGGSWTYPIYINSGALDMLYFVPKFRRYYDQSSIDATSFLPYANIPVLRMEEVLLSRAEAYIMTDQYERALADLNMFASNRITNDYYSASRYYDPVAHCLTRDKVVQFYRSAVGSPEHYINKYNDIRGADPEFKKSLILTLLNFREVEFYWEGLRWYDILKWKIPVTHTTSQNSGGTSSTLLPDDDRRVLQLPESVRLAGIEQNQRKNVGEWN